LKILGRAKVPVKKQPLNRAASSTEPARSAQHLEARPADRYCAGCRLSM
jgi:hypothetical protein